MTPAEAAMVLTAAAAFDRRTVDESTAQAWAAALPDVRAADARDAVVAHYREKRDWIMPADIRAHVRRVRSKRFAEMPPINPPSELADVPHVEAEWRQRVTRRVLDGVPVAQAVADTCDEMAVPRPPEVPARTGPPPALRQAMKELNARTEVPE